MKRCPQCKRIEKDDALVFCRVDGAALLTDSSAVDIETARLDDASVATELDTSILPHRTDAQVSRDTGPTTVLRPSAMSPTLELSKSRPSKAVLLSVAAVVLIAIAISSYFIGRRLIGSPTDKAIESVAVLPFENRSGNADSEYLSDGLSESLIYRLSQLPNIKVSPRSSVFRYKGKEIDAEKIGAELGVDAVMSGRIFQRGDNLSISVDLVDVRNNKTLWGEQYERKMSDLLATQREIATAITAKLQMKLSGEGAQKLAKKYTDNNEAYQLYL